VKIGTPKLFRKLLKITKLQRYKITTLQNYNITILQNYQLADNADDQVLRDGVVTVGFEDDNVARWVGLWQENKKHISRKIAKTSARHRLVKKNLISKHSD
jgi:hypothetical protein